MMPAPSPSVWPAIISSAAASPLGLAALALLAVSLVSMYLFGPKDSSQLRVTVIVLLSIFCGGLFGGAVYSARPSRLSQTTSASNATASADHVTPLTSNQSLSAASHTPLVKNVQPPASALSAHERVGCGSAWTGWVEVGGGVADPCPFQCVRGDELGQSYRVVGFPPKATNEIQVSMLVEVALSWNAARSSC